MSILRLREFAVDKTNFETLQHFIDFARTYSDFLTGGGIQASIVARNERDYRFFQYREEADYAITRPINGSLFHDAENIDSASSLFRDALKSVTHGEPVDPKSRAVIPSYIYTMQQSIGATLDALPAGRSNQARKVNGDLFERLIGLLLNEIGIDCTSGTLKVPVKDDSGQTMFSMSYQHDVMLKVEGELKVIGSVKTSSKDRIDKIFMDKFLYSRLTETATPHIAIFLNDVQRKGSLPKFGVAATFLPGHFKGYTVKLNPLDGVYYCDIRPNMRSDALLAQHIGTIDKLFCDDLPKLLAAPGLPLGEVKIESDGIVE